MAMADRPEVHVERRDEWRRWLAEHHASSTGAWLVSWKRATGKPSVDYDAAVEEGLCFGWIDSQARTLDEERSALMFTPRKPGSRWSRSNKERVARLEAAGLIEALAGDARRKPYALTTAGVEHARAELRKLSALADEGTRRLKAMPA
jgi:uncharacterized protein YdeI (YjbR/CyaY-like superfamily)